MPKVLYLSSSIGLGHASKDLAIAAELRRARPGIEVEWLAGVPTAGVLVSAGETLAPEAERWQSATLIAERSMRGGQLRLVGYVYRALPSFFHNMGVVKAALRRTGSDVVVGNEAWEVFVPLVMRVLHLPVPLVMIGDFVGVETVGRGLFEKAGAWFLNALWSMDAGVMNGHPHSMIFIGEPDDIPDTRLGWALPNRRRHAVENYRFVGHVVRFRPEDYTDRESLRRRLGYGDEPLVICAVGGTTVGAELLNRCGDAFALIHERLPGVRMVLVRGPRIRREAIRAPKGVDVLGYVDRLYEHFACADVAIVQCGASSTTELAALGTPFVYVPVPGHYEQELVAARLERYGAGQRLALADASPEALVGAVTRALARGRAATEMPVDGARVAAEHILHVMESGAGPP